MRTWIVVPLLTVLAVVGALLVRPPGDADVSTPTARATPRGASVPAQADVELVRFDSCRALADDLADLAVTALDHAGVGGVAPFGPTVMGGAEGDVADQGAGGTGAGGDDLSASSSTTSVAGTNIQVAGVDEADRVKLVDGRVVTLDSGHLVVVDVQGSAPVEVGRLELDVPADRMLVDGDRVLLMATEAIVMPFAGGRPFEDLRAGSLPPLLPVPGREPTSTFVVVDLSDPTAPREVERLELDGAVVAGRLADGVARVVVRSEPSLPVVVPTRGGVRGERAARDRNVRTIREADAQEWLPWAIHRDADGVVIHEGPLVDCDRVSRSARATDLAVTTVVGIDLLRGLDTGSPAAVVGGGDVVYATGDAVVLAAHRTPPGWWRTPDDGQRVGVHRFTTADPTAPGWTGSGSVPGRLLGQWALDEHEGVLRVATTTSWGPEAESMVVTLDAASPDLVELGRVTGLGPGETIQAVRFMAGAGYVVTYEQIDPLFVLDLADPSRPTVLGELEMPGFSAYLHPVGDGRVLGVGRDGTPDGRDLGGQVSLFDVRDATAPRRLDKLALGEGWSEVDADHHAFGWDPRRSLAFVPFQHWDDSMGVDRMEVVVVGVTAGGVTEVGRADIGQRAWSVRPLVVGDRLAAVGVGSVVVLDLDTLEPVGDPLLL